MATFLRPTWEKIRFTDTYDWYIVPGEPIGYRHLCAGGTKSIWGVDIPIGSQVEAWVSGGVAKDTKES